MNSREHARHMSRFHDLLERLRDAQDSREYLPMTLDEDGKMALYWNDFEKLVMYRAVNQFRYSLRKQFIAYKEIERVELMAAGHFDYTKKFALYCAELILKD